MENNYTFEEFVRRVRKYAPREFSGCPNPQECVDEAIRDNQEWLKGVFKSFGRRYPDEPKVTKEICKHVCKDTAGLLRWMW